MAEFGIDTSSLFGDELLLMLANPISTGNRFTELNFSVVVDDAKLINTSFMDLIDAVLYFNDNVFSLGQFAASVDADLDIKILIEMILSDIGDGFSFDYGVVINTPLPSAIYYLPSGL